MALALGNSVDHFFLIFKVRGLAQIQEDHACPYPVPSPESQVNAAAAPFGAALLETWDLLLGTYFRSGQVSGSHETLGAWGPEGA